MMTMMLGIDMSLEVRRLIERFIAQRAFVWHFACMNLCMPLKIGLLAETLPALIALVGLLACMSVLVVPQGGLVAEPPAAHPARERLLLRVLADVCHKVRPVRETFPAARVTALKWLGGLVSLLGVVNNKCDLKFFITLSCHLLSSSSAGTAILNGHH